MILGPGRYPLGITFYIDCWQSSSTEQAPAPPPLPPKKPSGSNRKEERVSLAYFSYFGTPQYWCLILDFEDLLPVLHQYKSIKIFVRIHWSWQIHANWWSSAKLWDDSSTKMSLCVNPLILIIQNVKIFPLTESICQVGEPNQYEDREEPREIEEVRIEWKWN